MQAEVHLKGGHCVTLANFAVGVHSRTISGLYIEGTLGTSLVNHLVDFPLDRVIFIDRGVLKGND